MSHIRATDIHRVLPPPVDLAWSRGPHDIIKEYISAARRKFEIFFSRDDSKSGGTYEALLNVGESTGGLRNAWGNMAVLHGRRGW